MRKPLAMLITAVLTACSGGGGDEALTTRLNLNMVDAPIDDASEVWVQFSGIEMQGPDGRIAESFTPAKKINLLAQTGGNSAPLLTNFELTAGDYQWIRLQVDTESDLDTYFVDKNGLSHELEIPSSAQTGLKLNNGFTLAQGGRADFTIDFDVRHSLVQSGAEYKLKPVLRLVDNLQVGTVQGTVAQALIQAHCDTDETGAVYLYRNGVVAPNVDDIGGSGDQPLSSANVILSNDNTYQFTIGFIESGIYTVAWTCDAELDDPQSNDAVNFYGAQTIDVRALQTTSVDLI